MFNEPLLNVWYLPSLNHYVYDASYNKSAKSANYIVIVGKDVNNEIIYGSAIDTTEQSLTGDRLDFKFYPYFITGSYLNNIANSVLVKERLKTVSGFIIAPPNIAIELWDVVLVYDSLFSHDPIKYRICGFDFVYNAITSCYAQKLYLCGM